MGGASNTPRIVIAGLAGDSGKSIVSMALLRALRGAGIDVRAFKKGPDYIDAAWLSWASAASARNLDSWLMGLDTALRSFAMNATQEGFNLVEGNRGLFDGVDIAGTHSTAELAKAIQAPVLLVLNVTKMTRTAAALVLGCKHLDPDLRIAGVILNHVAGKRHEMVVREAIESYCGIPVVGVIPKLRSAALPQRHLGLVTPEDHPCIAELHSILDQVASKLDLAQIQQIAADVSALPAQESARSLAGEREATGVRVAVIRDAAFSFYYQENIEALQKTGAEVVSVSALSARALPENINALYIGGGFPEVHAAELEANRSFRDSLAAAAGRDLPIYAECGGLMLLSRSIHWNGRRYAMANVLPIDIETSSAPEGHGYVEMIVDTANPYYPVGTVLLGHEFHYSRIAPQNKPPITACLLRRGTGACGGRDGLITNNVWASYTHVHASATPEWADGLIKLARRHRACEMQTQGLANATPASEPSRIEDSCG
jgi:cobyrinic acid a,c-diamide synthase